MFFSLIQVDNNISLFYGSNLKPGGWIEFEEGVPHIYSDDDTVESGNNVAKMLRLLVEACDKVDQTAKPFTAFDFKGLIREVGFQNVEQKHFKVPVGTWPKDKRLVS